jgi:antitoxin-like ribbon-helix-helix protein
MSADPDLRRKRIAFDAETSHALHRLSLDSMRSLQELADEAFRDLLKKHHRPVTLKDALQRSLRMHPANEQPKATVHRLRRRG